MSRIGRHLCRVRRRSICPSRARESAHRFRPHDSGTPGGHERSTGHPQSRVRRLSLECDRVAVVHASDAVFLADGARRCRRAKGRQLLGVGPIHRTSGRRCWPHPATTCRRAGCPACGRCCMVKRASRDKTSTRSVRPPGVRGAHGGRLSMTARLRAVKFVRRERGGRCQQ
jgi:hypothetical protein